MGIIYLLPIDPRMKMLVAFALGLNLLSRSVYNIGIEAHKAAHRIGRYSAIHTSQSLLGFSVGILIIMMTPLARRLRPL